MSRVTRWWAPAAVAILLVAACSAKTSPAPVGTSIAPASTPAPGATQTGATAPTAAAITAAPTAVPATAAPTPEPTQEPGFAAVTFSGSGAKVQRLAIAGEAAAIVVIQSSGKGHFAVWSLGATGKNIDLLVNEIGAYRGTRLINISEPVAALKIAADGAWKIVIRPLADAKRWNGTTVLKDSGDDVVIVDPPVAGLATASLTHSGTAHFAVWSYSSDQGRDLLVNEIGAYSGEVQLPDGTFLIEVTADGAWTVTPT